MTFYVFWVVAHVISNIEQRWFWGPRFVGEGIPRFWSRTYIFKSHSLPSTWPIFA